MTLRRYNYLFKKDMLVLIDPGHGGIINGQYQTSGKRSPKWDNLPQLFEGVQNRDIAKELKQLLADAKIKWVDVTDESNYDIPLNVRTKVANDNYSKNKNAIYVSIHADAHGDGVVGTPAKGISVWTSKGQTNSDKLADFVFERLSHYMSDLTTMRKDTSDGDNDKEENFFVLSKTNCPAILCELGFMTNYDECKRMQTQDWKKLCAYAIFEGIKKYYMI